MDDHQHQQDSNDHHHEHHHEHGHANDRGFAAMLRYLRRAPRMWHSEVNDAVIDLVAPRPGERVLDIGAGVGPGTIRAAAAGASVVAVEPTPYMRSILSARRLFQRTRANISVVDGSAEELPLTDSSIDAVWAVNTMHHWTDPDQGVAEICRVLRPGGRVFLVDEDFEDPDHPEFDRFAARQSDHRHHGFTMVDAGQMGERFRQGGLVEIEATKRQIAARPVIAVIGQARR